MHSSMGQKVSSDLVSDAYPSIPQEQLWIHHNSSLVFAGEYFYFKIYCLNKEGRSFSDLSKVAYVHLVNEKRQVMFRKKIRLNDGSGQGDLFIPASLPSGNYKLVGFTNWMKNQGVAHFHQSDLVVLNPYTNQQSVFFEGQSEVNPSIVETTSNISIDVSKTIFKKREKVPVTIRTGKRQSMAGDFSVSVRKVNAMEPGKPSFNDRSRQVVIQDERSDKAWVYLPELRGEIISGVLRDRVSEGPVPNAQVAMSIPGKGFIIKIAKTNSYGEFFFNIDENYRGENATFQVISEVKNNMAIELSALEDPNYDDLVFGSFTLTIDMKEEIERRSVYNQIENAYFELKPDSVKALIPTLPFYGENAKVYNLDDYNRFATVKETFVEFIDDAWIRPTEIGNRFYVRPYELSIPSSFPPLIIIDGIVIQDHELLYNYSSRKIQRITIKRDKYFLGSGVFQGIIAVETIGGNFYDTVELPYLLEVDLWTAEQPKQYYQQRYSEGTGNSSRIPDYRSQLYWEPDFQFSGSEATFDFYTSDNSGTYEIELQGFNFEGIYLHAVKRIEVK